MIYYAKLCKGGGAQTEKILVMKLDDCPIQSEQQQTKSKTEKDNKKY